MICKLHAGRACLLPLLLHEEDQQSMLACFPGLCTHLARAVLEANKAPTLLSSPLEMSAHDRFLKGSVGGPHILNACEDR